MVNKKSRPNNYKASHKNLKFLAGAVAKNLRGGEVLGLIGNLGAGKTTFTQHLGKNLKVKRKITSPTFTIMNEFSGYLQKRGKKITIYHLDLYRTKSFKEVAALGITEEWQKPNQVTVIEWANKIKSRLPQNTIIINFATPKKSAHENE